MNNSNEKRIIEMDQLESLQIAVLLKCEIHKLEQFRKDIESVYLDENKKKNEVQEIKQQIKKLEELTKIFFI